MKSKDSQDLTQAAEHSFIPNISYPEPLVPQEFSNRFSPNKKKKSEHWILLKNLKSWRNYINFLKNESSQLGLLFSKYLYGKNNAN